MGAYSRELVSVGTCRHFRDSSTASVRQRRVHILKTGTPEVIRQVQFPVGRPSALNRHDPAPVHSRSA